MAFHIDSKTALRLALVATAAASLSACQSRPKPTFATTTPTQTGPGQTGPAGPSGVPGGTEVGQAALPGSERDFVVNVGDRVYFDFDSYSLREDARPLLAAQAAWLKRYGAVRVRIEGNTDERGTREYNLALGARRANAVRDFLAGQGVTTDRITTISYGKERPIDPGSSEEAYAQNRNARTAIVSGGR